MLRTSHKLPFVFLAALEAVILITVICMAEMLVRNGALTFAGDEQTIVYRSCSAALIFVTSLFAFGFYNWEFASGFAEVLVRAAAAYFVSCLAFLVLGYVLLTPTVSAWAFAGATVVSAPIILTIRNIFLHLAEDGWLKHRILVLGVGDAARRLHELEHGSVIRRFAIVGYLKCGEEDVKVHASPVLASPGEVKDFLRHADIDEIVVAVQDRRGNLPLDELIEARFRGIRISDYQTFSERVTGRVDLQAVRPSWFLYSSGFGLSSMQRGIKRGFDIIVSLLCLILLSPIFIAAALAIAIEGGGAVFYRQERVGLNGRPYMLIKFRSMRADAERDGVPRWAGQNDPRVTFLGNFMRKTRIDELPQILNVLYGDMSFVGPRPERPFFVDQLASSIPFYNDRHRVKPGITGWAQLNFSYGASAEDARKKLEYDLYYIRNVNIILDLLIIIQTLRVVVFFQGAR